MDKCKHIKDRTCEPTDCFLTSSTAALTSMEGIGSKALKDLDNEYNATVTTTMFIAEKLRDCALEILAGDNEWIRELHDENLREAQKETERELRASKP